MTTPPVNLGNYGVEESDLGAFVHNGGGAGTASVAIALVYTNLTIKNPNGANVLVIGGLSAYGSAVGAKAGLYLQIDSDNWATRQIGQFYFNLANYHIWLGDFIYVTGILPPGSHSFGFILDPLAGTIYNDATYDHITFVGLELP